MREVVYQRENGSMESFRTCTPLSPGAALLSLNPGGVAVLLCRDNAGEPWLVMEDSYYEPDSHDVDAGYEGSWATNGTQWYINLNDGIFTKKKVSYKEGEIQGIVYALLNVHSGPLEPVDYWEYITDSLNETTQANDTRMKPVTRALAKKIGTLLDISSSMLLHY